MFCLSNIAFPVKKVFEYYFKSISNKDFKIDLVWN